MWGDVFSTYSKHSTDIAVGGGGGYVLSTYSYTQNLHQDSSISLDTSHATTKEGYRYTTSVDIIINNMHHKRLVTYWESQITGNVCNECLRVENNAYKLQLVDEHITILCIFILSWIKFCLNQ